MWWLSFVLLLTSYFNRCLNAMLTELCCRQQGVSEACNHLLCNPHSPPNDFDVYNIFEPKYNCLPHMNAIAECLADRRDHGDCCFSEAKDRDENACFGLCRGEGTDGVAAWDKYQTCLAVNLHPMFRCFERGYLDTPTSPQSVHIVAKTTDSAVLAWSPPAVNAHLAESYQIICKEADSGIVEKNMTTRALKVTVSGLRADSKYFAHIVAISRDGHHRSLPSETIHFYTNGVAPRAVAYRDNVVVPREAFSATIACRMQMPGTIHKSAHFEWKKFDNKSGQFEVISGDKYNLANYISVHEHPRHYVSALQIKFLKLSDFGIYRCVASNNFGSSSAEIHLSPRTATPAALQPPEPPHICCQRLGIRSPCVTVCGSELGKRASLRADAFMNSRCEDEIGKFLTCTVAGIDEGACCLRKKVPGICLPLCDGSQKPSGGIPHTCAAHTFSIFQCRLENADNQPATVSGLRVSHQSDCILLGWDSTERADKYHVYWKSKSFRKWELTSTVRTSKRVCPDDVDEVVVVASNNFGNAHPARLVNLDGKWTTSYHI